MEGIPSAFSLRTGEACAQSPCGAIEGGVFHAADLLHAHHPWSNRRWGDLANQRVDRASDGSRTSEYFADDFSVEAHGVESTFTDDHDVGLRDSTIETSDLRHQLCSGVQDRTEQGSEGESDPTGCAASRHRRVTAKHPAQGAQAPGTVLDIVDVEAFLGAIELGSRHQRGLDVTEYPNEGCLLYTSPSPRD